MIQDTLAAVRDTVSDTATAAPHAFGWLTVAVVATVVVLVGVFLLYRKSSRPNVVEVDSDRKRR